MATLYHPEDSFGNAMTVKKYDGTVYITLFIGNVKDHLEKLEGLKVRDDDVYICAHPRSGTHWTHTTVSMLVNGSLEYDKEQYHLDATEVEFLDNMRSPRIIMTHLPFEKLPLQLRNGKGKIINIRRNPKDALVSWYVLQKDANLMEYNGPWEGFLELYFRDEAPIQSTWYDHVKSFECRRTENKNILYLVYEDVNKNFEENIRKMADFLDVSYGDEFIHGMIEKCSFQCMQRSIKFHPVLKEKGTMIYRKGIVGDWKNWFTVAQNEQFDKFIEEKMKGFDLNIQYE